MKRLASLVLLGCLIFAASPAFAAEEPMFSRTYASDVLTPYALEALLWDACPDDLAGVECVIARHEGRLGMTAPASVHRAVVGGLAEVEARGEGLVRVDLVIAEPGAADSLTALPAVGDA